MDEIEDGRIFFFKPPIQSLKAWEAFYDARGIFFNLSHLEVEEELYEWRIGWIAGVSILRSIGHILAKVDAVSSQANKTAIDLWWSEIKSQKADDHIFWGFIDKERNNILKTYKFRIEPQVEDGELSMIYDQRYDAVSLFRQSVYWWGNELLKLECSIMNP